MALKSCVLVMLLALLGGCLPTQSQQFMERDLEEMKRRLAELERRTAGVGADGMLGLQDRFAELGRRQAETQAGLDALRVEFQSGSGRLADFDHRLKQQAEELGLVREDLSLRLAALEDRVTTAALARPETGGSTRAAAPGPESSPEALYQAGLDKVRSGTSLDGARKDFRSFLERYPKHELAVNAQYWIGETYYGEKSFENAVLQFQEVIDNYPRHPKVASALLKQALAFEALGDKKSARLRLEQVVRDFPASPEAAKARARLK